MAFLAPSVHQAPPPAPNKLLEVVPYSLHLQYEMINIT